jgi:uncharacterized cupin superfamily protein
VVAEAKLEGGVPQTGGWFVVNARDVPWQHNELRSVARFGGEGEAHFDDLGVSLYRLAPGQAMSMYHYEAGQEDFMLLRGQATAIVEGVERPMVAWDLLHCPPRVPHTIVAAGDEPVLVLAVGARKERGSARYPVELAATRRGAGVQQPSATAAHAYRAFSTPTIGPPPPEL